MAHTIRVEVLSTEAQIYSGDAEYVILPGQLGELGVYPRHAPLLTTIRHGRVRIKPVNGEEEILFVAGGVLEVQPAVVTVLADTAVRGKDLDEAKALAAKQRAEAALKAATDKAEITTVEKELALIAAQLATIRELRQHHH